MSRFVDIEPNLHEITNFEDNSCQCLSLTTALQSLRPVIRNLQKNINIAKRDCHFPSKDGLTHEESAAIYLYTLEWDKTSLYKLLNEHLRSRDRELIKLWIPYLKLFNSALNKLPDVQKMLWRAIKIDSAKRYKQHADVTWWGISSCSSSLHTIEGFIKGNSRIFAIHAKKAKDISRYSRFPKEDEHILRSETRLRVLSDELNKDSIHIVHLEEICNNQAVEIISVYQILIDEFGNRYEGFCKFSQKHGKGKMIYVNGNQYEGDWVDDQINGSGSFIWTDGRKYQGQFQRNKMEGEGLLTWRDGRKYNGQFSENLISGKGTMTWPDGSQYEMFISIIFLFFFFVN